MINFMYASKDGYTISANAEFLEMVKECITSKIKRESYSFDGNTDTLCELIEDLKMIKEAETEAKYGMG